MIYCNIYIYNIKICSVYGDIVKTGNKLTYLTHDVDEFKLTGVDRTGCMFCMFGCHLEEEPNRFQRIKRTHPKQWEYMMKPVENGGLGLKAVLNYIGVKYE